MTKRENRYWQVQLEFFQNLFSDFVDDLTDHGQGVPRMYGTRNIASPHSKGASYLELQKLRRESLLERLGGWQVKLQERWADYTAWITN